ncbi:MAG TPA: hypothetical protein VGU67_02930 [Edaphobacter sp.]|nr:hypothetical protein [Edaphobacter sp.]
MLQDVNDVIKRVGVLMDDPSGSTFTREYLMPFVDQEYDEMDVELERNGMQYVESTAILTVPPLTTDLISFLGDSQPLATMKFPKYIKWKLTSQTDEFYQLSNFVQELDEVNPANIPVTQWRNAQGSIQITPSAQTVNLKVYFDTISTNIYDPTQQVIRGTAHILAPRVAAAVCATGGDLTKRFAYFDAKWRRNWNAFLVVLVQQQSQRNISNPPIHGARPRAGMTAGGASYT